MIINSAIIDINQVIEMITMKNRKNNNESTTMITLVLFHSGDLRGS